ncbi:gp53-like domain-containing protein [Enterobacter roggenkampii]
MTSFSTGNINAFRIPTGHIVQLDNGVVTSGGFSKSFPTPFPTACQIIVGVVLSTSGLRYSVTGNTTDRTTANMIFIDQNGNGLSGITGGYIAIGH